MAGSEDHASHGMVGTGSCRSVQNKQEGIRHWYLSRKEIEENSPSRRDGIDLKKETYIRKSYCTFLQDLGMKIKVPQVTIATAIMFCHRFFLHQSHAKNDRRIVATVSMFLAGKVEDTPRPLKDVIIVSYELTHKKDPVAAQRIKQKDVYEQQKELILLGERVVLTTLGFDLNILHPYKPLVEAIKKLKVAQNSLAQVAWNFVNDGLRTSLCLQFKSHHIAAGAIFLAAKFLKVKLPTEGDKVWWKEFDVTSRQLEEVSNQMLELYEQNKTPVSQGSDAGGRSNNHVAPEKSASATEGSVVVNGHSQVEGPSTVKPHRLSSHKEDGPHCSQSLSNGNGSTETKSDISEHRLDDDFKEHRHPEQHPVSSTPDKVREGSDLLKGSPERVDGRSTAVKSENGTVSSISETQALENKESVGLVPEDCINKIDKEKFKAALQKRKKLRTDVAPKKEVMDDDDLIERELEDGVELAVECEKVKRESMHDNGNHIETGSSRGLQADDDAEDGEVDMSHDDDRIGSPNSNAHKRKAESPCEYSEGKQTHDQIEGNENGRLGHKRHALENHVRG